jgi:hypothetical protein
MSNRTWVCVGCGKSYRRDQSVDEVPCSLCGAPCEDMHWKLRIPSPKKKKDWIEFWTTYRREKRLIEEFQNNPKIQEITLELLNQHWRRS